MLKKIAMKLIKHQKKLSSKLRWYSQKVISITIDRRGYWINRQRMVMSRKFIKLIIIKKINWSKMCKYSIKQHNTSIIALQFQGTSYKFLRYSLLDFVHSNMRGSNGLLIHWAALHCTDSINSIFLDMREVHTTFPLAAHTPIRLPPI